MATQATKKIKSKIYEKENHGRLPLTRGGSLSREDLTKPWRDNPAEGIVFQLINYSSIGIGLTNKMLEGLILWKHRTIKETINKFLKRSCLDMYIETKEMFGSSEVYHYLDPVIRDFTTAIPLIKSSYYKKIWGPNKPEQILLNYLSEFVDGIWIFTGDIRIPENRIKIENKIVVPDIINYETNQVLEHYGSWYHSFIMTGEDENFHEINRVALLARGGLKSLITWEDKLKKQRKKEFERIYEFSEITKNLTLPSDPDEAESIYVKLYKEKFWVPRENEEL